MICARRSRWRKRGRQPARARPTSRSGSGADMVPGHEVVFTDTPQRRPGFGEDTRTGFIVAEAERGPTFPVYCTSLAAVVAKFGSRQSYSFLYDASEAFFAEGGAG